MARMNTRSMKSAAVQEHSSRVAQVAHRIPHRSPSSGSLRQRRARGPVKNAVPSQAEEEKEEEEEEEKDFVHYTQHPGYQIILRCRAITEAYHLGRRMMT